MSEFLTVSPSNSTLCVCKTFGTNFLIAERVLCNALACVSHPFNRYDSHKNVSCIAFLFVHIKLQKLFRRRTTEYPISKVGQNCANEKFEKFSPAILIDICSFIIFRHSYAIVYQMEKQYKIRRCIVSASSIPLRTHYISLLLSSRTT